MKIVIAVRNDRVLVFWSDNNLPFVVAATPSNRYAVGEIINEWHWGKYFSDLQLALDCFNQGGVKK